MSVGKLCMQQADNRIRGRSELVSIRTGTEMIRSFTSSERRLMIDIVVARESFKILENSSIGFGSF